MWRVVTSTFFALTFVSSVASAQQPCTTDANRVVSELYRHILERAPDAGAQTWQQQLANGSMTVRQGVRNLVTSQEYMQRFGQPEAGEAVTYERAVAALYRHILGRQPDAEGQRNWAITAQKQNLTVVADAILNSQEYTNAFGDWGVPGSGGLNFCANNNQSNNNNNNNNNQPQANQVTEPRFRGMDRNRDGIISRAEWRGSAQSFDVQDWDGNGVLEGNEVRAGAVRPGRGRGRNDVDVNQQEDFDYLDANNNGRVERREWQSSLDLFNRLDTNRDGILTRAEANQSAAIGTTGEVVSVDSSVRWTDTGIDVRAGDTLTFNADGRVRLSDNAGDSAFASGAESGRRAAAAPVPNAPAGGLIARIANGQAVYVGDRRSLRAPRAGRQFLGVNDDHLADNDGVYRVTVDVR